MLASFGFRHRSLALTAGFHTSVTIRKSKKFHALLNRLFYQKQYFIHDSITIMNHFVKFP
jgi:hypothetical protein